MAQTGSYGPVIFEVGPGRLLTPGSVEESISGRWDVHDVAGAEPVPEFNGPGQRSGSLSVILSVQNGVDVQQEIDTLTRIAEAGEVHSLIIGSRAMGGAGSLWALTNLSLSRTHYSQSGVIIRAEAELSFLRARTVNTPRPISATVVKQGTQKRR